MLELIAYLHSQVGFRLPIDLAALAGRASVRLHPLSAACPAEEIALADRAFVRWSGDARTLGASIASGVVGALAVRHGITLGPLERRELAAELLAPAWAVDRHPSPEAAIAQFTWAPQDVVRERWHRAAARRVGAERP